MGMAPTPAANVVKPPNQDPKVNPSLAINALPQNQPVNSPAYQNWLASQQQPVVSAPPPSTALGTPAPATPLGAKPVTVPVDPAAKAAADAAATALKTDTAAKPVAASGTAPPLVAPGLTADEADAQAAALAKKKAAASGNSPALGLPVGAFAALTNTKKTALGA